MATEFETDKATIHTDSVEIMMRRKAELARIEREGRTTKNRFRMQFLAQEYARLKAEYEKLDALI